MQHVLAARLAVGAEEIDGFGASRLLQTSGQALGDGHAMREQLFRQVKNRRVVGLGDDQCMPLTHGLNIQKRYGAVVFINDADHLLAANDPAENARLIHVVSPWNCSAEKCTPVRPGERCINSSAVLNIHGRRRRNGRSSLGFAAGRTAGGDTLTRPAQ